MLLKVGIHFIEKNWTYFIQMRERKNEFNKYEWEQMGMEGIMSAQIL